MPFILLAFGILLFVTAINGTTRQVGTLIKQDVFGTGAANKGFIYWIVAIGMIGAVGYIKPLKRLSDAFIVLVILSLFLKDKGGFFTQLTAALRKITSDAQGTNLSTQTGAAGSANNTIGALG